VRTPDRRDDSVVIHEDAVVDDSGDTESRRRTLMSTGEGTRIAWFDLGLRCRLTRWKREKRVP
jgi:hypothetical protein